MIISCLKIIKERKEKGGYIYKFSIWKFNLLKVGKKLILTTAKLQLKSMQ